MPERRCPTSPRLHRCGLRELEVGRRGRGDRGGRRTQLRDIAALVPGAVLDGRCVPAVARGGSWPACTAARPWRRPSARSALCGLVTACGLVPRLPARALHGADALPAMLLATPCPVRYPRVRRVAGSVAAVGSVGNAVMARGGAVGRAAPVPLVAWGRHGLGGMLLHVRLAAHGPRLLQRLRLLRRRGLLVLQGWGVRR